MNRARAMPAGSPAPSRLTQVAALRGAWGVLLLALPARVLGLVPGARATPGTCAVARVLGARHLVQASAALAGSQMARRAWWVDALHALSMLGLSAARPASRRLTATDAVLAAGWAAATRAAARQIPCGEPRNGTEPCPRNDGRTGEPD
jgi:hypothetical protein